MVEKKTDKAKNDIFAIWGLGFIFKNSYFLFAIRVGVLALFVYGIFLGFAIPNKENIFTKELFWGLFWSLFMVVSLATFGRIFCGICPHAFLGKYLNRYGLKKEMPQWLKSRWWGVLLLVIGWWAIRYSFPGFYKDVFVTALLFTILSIAAYLLFFLYKDMSYCKYICPIGSVSNAYQRLSFTWLGSYKEDCNECKTFACAKTCPYDLKPFTFINKNSMEDCTLCMDCAQSCDAINFKILPPAQSLYKKFKESKIEVWVFILITASITITMSFHHGLGRSAIASSMPWEITAHYFENLFSLSFIDLSGFFAFSYAIIITLALVYSGMYLASKALRASFSKVFYTLGYAFAPLFIIGGLAHLLHGFFTHTYADIVNGFIYGFSLDVATVSNLASRKDGWLEIFNIFKYIAAFWAFYIMYKRVNLFEATKKAKSVAFFFASLLIIFYLSIDLFRSYVNNTYPKVQTQHQHKVSFINQKKEQWLS